MIRSIVPKLFGQVLLPSSVKAFLPLRMLFSHGRHFNTKSVIVRQQMSRSHYNFPVSFYNTLVGKSALPLHLSYKNFPACPMLIQKRSIVKCSKKGKKKTVKAVAKRFYRTGSGKLKYWPAGHNHKMLAKSFNMRRNLRKPRYANKQQLKVLNKMISGW